MIGQHRVHVHACTHLRDLVESDHGGFPDCDKVCLRGGRGAEGGLKPTDAASLTEVVKSCGGRVTCTGRSSDIIIYFILVLQ